MMSVIGFQAAVIHQSIHLTCWMRIGGWEVPIRYCLN